MSTIGTQPYLSHKLFLQTMLDIVEAENLQTLKAKSLNVFCFKHAGYHHIPSIGSHDYPNLNRNWTFGLPKDILNYFNERNTKRDATMEYCFHKARPYWLSQILENEDFTNQAARKRINYFIKNLNDTIVIPLYGPFHKRGYAYLGFNQPREFYDDIFVWQIQGLIQAAHVKYCLIQESFRTSVYLTNRENEVLELITFGKTNPEIGKILGISTSTVSGYVKQIFLKLDVSDRVSAALRAQSFNFRPPTQS